MHSISTIARDPPRRFNPPFLLRVQIQRSEIRFYQPYSLPSLLFSVEGRCAPNGCFLCLRYSTGFPVDFPSDLSRPLVSPWPTVSWLFFFLIDLFFSQKYLNFSPPGLCFPQNCYWRKNSSTQSARFFRFPSPFSSVQIALSLVSSSRTGTLFFPIRE